MDRIMKDILSELASIPNMLFKTATGVDINIIRPIPSPKQPNSPHD